MADSTAKIRNMSREELGLVLDWAAEEGWDPGLHDGDSLFAIDPNGLFAAELDGQVVGGISAIAYGERFGFIGLHLSHPLFASHPARRALWERALTYLGGRTIGLEAPLDRQADYAADGFKTAHLTRRYRGFGAATAPKEAVDLRVFTFERFVNYDAGIFGARRTNFLRHWTDPREGKDVGVIGPDGVIAGYGVIRASRDGHKIGPLYADNRDYANVIYDALSSVTPGKPVFLDVPVPNEQGLDLAERKKMVPVFETARMYANGPADVDLHRVYGFTSPKLG